MDELMQDAALAAALLILELFDSSPGAPKPELIGQTVVIVIEAMKEANRRAAMPFPLEPSRN